MKKTLFIPFLFPFFAKAQVFTMTNTEVKKNNREFVAVATPAFTMIGLKTRTLPFFIEYKQKIRKRYLKFGLESLGRDEYFTDTRVMYDTTLQILHVTNAQNKVFIKGGLERHFYVKSNQKCRIKTSTELLVGITSDSRGYSNERYDLKSNTLLPSQNYYQHGDKKLMAGAIVGLGIDYALGNHIMFGVQWNNYIYHNFYTNRTDIRPYLIPYLAFRF